MMRASPKIVFLALFFLILISCVQAKVIYKTDNVASDYAVGDLIRGSINITFNKTNLDSVVRTNFANTSITLRDLLGANGFVQFQDYNCSTSNCLPGYVRKELINSLDFSSAEELIGFSLQGNGIKNLQNAQFTLDSNAAPSCFLNMGLDVLNQNKQLVTGNKYSNESCYEPRYGCFEKSGVDYSTLIMDAGTEYCERINLPIAPGFILGANITDRTAGTSGLKMRLRSMTGTLLSECQLPSLTQPNQAVECLAPYSSAAEKNLLVCVLPYGPGSNYKIRVETHAPCGTTDSGISYPGDYEVYAKNLQFSSPRIELNYNTFLNASGLNLNEYIESYIADTYGSSCTPNCIVPFRIFGVAQNIQITNPYLKYTTSLGGSTEATSIYRIASSNVSIDSGLMSVNLDLANFSIPFGAKENNLDIYIDGDRVLRKSINLSTGFDFDISPLFVAFGGGATFIGLSQYNISSSTWSFGDGSAVQSVSGASISHKYLQEGLFNLGVSLVRTDGVTSRRNFLIVVGDAKTAANLSINNMRGQMTNISKTISSYPTWLQEQLVLQIDYNALNSSLRELELSLADAKNSSDYEKVASDAFSLDFPKQIKVFKKGVVPLIIGANELNLAPLQAISRTDIADSQELNAAVVDWMTKNTASTIDFEQIVVEYPSKTSALATRFTIETKPRTSFGEGVNLFVNYNSQDLILASNSYEPRELEGATVFPLGANDQKIEFAILDSIQPDEIGAYISPEIYQLGDFSAGNSSCNFDNVCQADFGESRKTCPSDCKPWGTIIFILILIVVAGLASFAGIMWWYKTRYENSIFPNKRDLVNIMAFISSSIMSGVSEKDMKVKLKKNGWTGEQIAYAIKKYKKGSKSVRNMQTDAKFIKRPDFN